MQADDKPKLSLEDFAWTWVAGFFAMLAAASTLVVLELDSDVLLRATIKPLFPGIFVASRIYRDEHVVWAILFGVVTNALVYGGAILVGRLLWIYVADKQHLR